MMTVLVVGITLHEFGSSVKSTDKSYSSLLLRDGEILRAAPTLASALVLAISVADVNAIVGLESRNYSAPSGGASIRELRRMDSGFLSSGTGAHALIMS
jgi:hypothetical protein